MAHKMQVEKRKLLQIFIMHFLHIYDNWEPDNSLKLQDFGENYTGCSFGHPAEILLVLVQEIALLTTSITACKFSPIFCYLSYQTSCALYLINISFEFP